MSDKPRILFLSRYAPVHSSRPGCPRLAHFALELHGRAHSNLAILTPTGDLGSEVRGAFESVQIYSEPPPAPRTLAKVKHSLMNRASIDSRLSRPEYIERQREWVSTIISQIQPDLVFVRGIDSFPALPPSYKGPLIVDFVDALSMLARREALMCEDIFGRFRHNREARALARFEAEVLKRCDRALFISEIDSQAVGAESAEKCVVISNGVDVSYYQAPPETKRSSSAIFFGVQNYGPNADASHWIVNEIAPEMKRLLSDIEIRIIGPGAEAKLLAEAENQEAVRIVGEVQDLRPELHRGGVFLCPLRFGAGMKNKILVALAAGLPVVATSVAVEGMGLGKAVTVADTSEQLAKAVVETLSLPPVSPNPEVKNLLERYSWKTRGEQVLSMIQNLL